MEKIPVFDMHCDFLTYFALKRCTEKSSIFEEYHKENFYIGSKVAESQIKSLTYLWANNADIADLTGLEYAVKLETYNMKINNATDFSVISLLNSLDNLTIQVKNLNDNNFSNMNNLHIRTMDISDSNLTQQCIRSLYK